MCVLGRSSFAGGSAMSITFWNIVLKVRESVHVDTTMAAVSAPGVRILILGVELQGLGCGV